MVKQDNEIDDSLTKIFNQIICKTLVSAENIRIRDRLENHGSLLEQLRNVRNRPHVQMENKAFLHVLPQQPPEVSAESREEFAQLVLRRAVEEPPEVGVLLEDRLAQPAVHFGHARFELHKQRLARREAVLRGAEIGGPVEIGVGSGFGILFGGGGRGSADGMRDFHLL